MKKIILLTLLIISFSGFSQKNTFMQGFPSLDISSPYYTLDQEIDLLMSEIDGSQLLQTNILIDEAIFENVTYSGYKTEDYDPNALENWEQMLYSLSKAMYKKNHVLYNKYEEYINENYCKSSDTVYLAVLDYHYDKILDEAFPKELLYVTKEVIYESGFTDVSPYETLQTYNATILNKELFSKGEMTFVLKSDLYFTNHFSNDLKIQVDFDDGKGFQEIAFDQEIPVYYSEFGKKLITIRTISEDKIVLEAGINTIIKDCNAFPVIKGAWMIPPSKSYVQGNADSTVIGQLELYSKDSAIDNPVIFIEGLDYFNECNSTELFANLNKNNLIYNLINHPDGFDVLILNIKNKLKLGEPDLFQYSYVIDSLIGNIKAKTSNKMKIIGLGTGGLVARMALARMETEERSHNTNLMITIDCPNQGANIALGDQFWADQVSPYSIKANRTNIIVQSKIGRQLLVYNKNAIKGTALLNDSLKIEFYNALLSYGLDGYPEKDIRKVAISHGSGYGNIIFHEGVQLVNWEFVEPFMNYTGEVYALSTSNSSLIFNSTWGSEVVSKQEVIISDALPYDNAPGSTVNTTFDIGNSMLNYGNIFINQEKHCFVPTISSFDIKNADVLDENISVNYNSLDFPFDSLYFHSENLPHLEMSSMCDQWIFDEIIGNKGSVAKTINQNKIGETIPEENISIYSLDNKIVNIVVVPNDQNSNTEIEVINSLGQIIERGIANNGKYCANLSGNPKGIYFVKMKIGNNIKVAKFLHE